MNDHSKITMKQSDQPGSQMPHVLWLFRSFNSFDPFFVGVRRGEGASNLLCMNTFLLTGVHEASDRGQTVHYTDID